MHPRAALEILGDGPGRAVFDAELLLQRRIKLEALTVGGEDQQAVFT